MIGKIIRRIYGILMGIIIQIVCLYEWIPLTEGKANTLDVFLHIIRSDDIMETALSVVRQLPGYAEYMGFMDGNEQAIAVEFLVFTGSLFIAQVLAAIYIPLSFFGRGLMLCGVAGLIFAFIPVYMSAEMTGLTGTETIIIYSGVVLATFGITFIGSRYLEDIGEARRDAKARRKRDKEFRKEKRRRLKFKGRYSSLFYHAIWDNSRSRWGDYIIFIIVGGIATGFIVVGFGMWAMLKGQQLNTILLNFLFISMVVSVFLIVNILLFYLKSRMNGYTLLLNLGMRRMTLKLYMAVELTGCILLSVVCGVLFENLLLLGLKSILTKNLGAEVVAGELTKQTWILIFISISVLFLLSLMLTRDNYYSPEALGTQDQAVMSEPVGVRHNILSVLWGGCLIGVSVYYYMKRNMSEYLIIPGCFLLGIYFFSKSVWGLLLRCKRKIIPLFYRGLLTDNYKYYRFKTTFRYMFFLLVIHMIVMFVYTKDIAAAMTAEKPEYLLPYDYVCIGDSKDAKTFKKLEKDGLIEQKTYPVVKVSNISKEEKFSGLLINGQQIGISETTYKKMCEQAGAEPKKLRLSKDGSSVYIIYQQDRTQKARPLDHYMLQSKPCLRIGEPEVESVELSGTWYREIKKKYPEREIAGEEKNILTGAAFQGIHQNIVVFSDEYMESAEYKGSNRLILLTLNSEEARPSVQEKLSEFKEKHAKEELYDAEVPSYYAKEEVLPQITRKRVMNTNVNVFIACLFFITGFIMFFMKVKAEMEERKKQHVFLSLVGMGPKARHRMIRSEFIGFLFVPLVTAALITAGFIWLTINLRIYTAIEQAVYAKMFGKMCGGYAVIWGIGMFILYCYTVREVEK